MTLEDYDDMYSPDLRPFFRVVRAAVAGLLLCGVLSLLIGCSPKVIEVPVPQVHTEYVSKTDTLIRKDSVYFRDSVYIIQRGDTIYHNAYHTIYKDKLVYNTKTDTIHKTDTVTVVQRVEVEKKVSWWQRVKAELGGVLLLLLVAVALFLAARWWIKNRLKQ